MSAVRIVVPAATHSVKLRAKWVYRHGDLAAGDGLAGRNCLILATYLHVGARHIDWAALLLVGVMVRRPYSVAGRHYIAALTESISQHSHLMWSKPRSCCWTGDYRSSGRQSHPAPIPRKILYALSISFEVEQQELPTRPYGLCWSFRTGKCGKSSRHPFGGGR